MRRNRPEGIPWRWDGALAMLGLARLATRSTGLRDSLAAFITRYFRHHQGRISIGMPDHCAPALAAVTARSILGETAMRAAVAPVATFLRSQPRNGLGALDHLGVDTFLSAVYPASIWIDSLMMYAVPAVVLGRELHDPQLEAFGQAQPEIFAHVLQDPQTGLFRHAYLHEREITRPRRPVFWLRGNGWVAAALADMLEQDHRSYPQNLAIFQKLGAALCNRQSLDGSWPTVIADEATYAEASGTALVGYALAKGWRLGLLPPSALAAAERAMAALVGRLKPTRGGLSLPGISGPTIPTSRSGYALVPRRRDIDYGVGAFVMLALELEAHHEENRSMMQPNARTHDYQTKRRLEVCQVGTREFVKPLNCSRSWGR